MTTELTQAYAILYAGADGAIVHGDLCRTLECAVTNINPLEGQRVIGYAVCEPRPVSAVEYRTRMLDRPLPVPALTIGDLADAAADGFRDGYAKAAADAGA